MSAKDISIAFGNNLLFEQISFNIHEKDRICLVGRNGTGKSTLFKIINQILVPDEGELWTKPSITIGYLPQKIAFQPTDTIYDYIYREAEIGRMRVKAVDFGGDFSKCLIKKGRKKIIQKLKEGKKIVCKVPPTRSLLGMEYDYNY